MQKIEWQNSFGFSSFGMLMPDRTYSTGYRFGFNGKESDNEVKGFGNSIAFEARIYDSRLGRWLSRDPRESEYAWQSTYAYYRNSPIATVDYLGMGDYYDKKGKHLGSDGKTVTEGEGKNAKQVPDGKAYVCEAVVVKDNIVQSATNEQDLGVSNSVLNQYANTVAQESSGDKTESYALASAIKNLANANYKGNIYNTLSAKNQIFGFTDGGNSTKYKSNSEYGMEAVINALTGGSDYSNGAIRWDGFDFAKNGLDHIKSTSAGLNIDAEHLKTFSNYSLYTNYSPTNPATAGIHLATVGDNKGMCLYSSTAAHGGTIFWGKNGKDFAIKANFPKTSFHCDDNGQINPGQSKYFTITTTPNSNFKGSW
jgi:RHS repeat-associated protein